MGKKIFCIGIFSPDDINKNVFVDKIDVIQKGDHLGFTFQDNFPDVYDLELIQQNVSFDEYLLWSVFNGPSEYCGQRDITVKTYRNIVVVLGKKHKNLISVAYKLKFSGNLESDFRTFYSVVSAFENICL